MLPQSARLCKTLLNVALGYGHFVAAFTATLSQKTTATLSHKPICVVLPLVIPIARGCANVEICPFHPPPPRMEAGPDHGK